MIIRPSFTVLSGAAIGLVAGAAVYGAVSSSADQTSTPAKATVAAVPASAAQCAAGLKLEDGVCVVHVVKTVVVPSSSSRAGRVPHLGARPLPREPAPAAGRLRPAMRQRPPSQMLTTRPKLRTRQRITQPTSAGHPVTPAARRLATDVLSLVVGQLLATPRVTTASMPPVGEVATTSSPPAATAVRRTMSGRLSTWSRQVATSCHVGVPSPRAGVGDLEPHQSRNLAAHQ